VRIYGLTFAGTSTEQRGQMCTFVSEILGLEKMDVPDVEADLFRLPDGATFAVASLGGMGPTERSIGFLVDDLDSAVVELRSAGFEVDEPVNHEGERYVHFLAPDRQLYELVERSPG